jgi:polysaccharide export outer membrane protein
MANRRIAGLTVAIAILAAVAFEMTAPGVCPARALSARAGPLPSFGKSAGQSNGQPVGQSGGGRSDARPAGDRDSSSRGAAGGRSDENSSHALVSGGEDYRIGAGDVIGIEIEDAPELSGDFRVTAAGAFLMHYLGRIVAQGKTTEELAKLIADGLRERYIFDPRVTVTVKQHNSHSFFIQGAVQGAGVYQIESRPSLLELITLAGGLSPNHGSTAFIIRKIKPGAPTSPAMQDGANQDAQADAKGAGGPTEEKKRPDSGAGKTPEDGERRAEDNEIHARYTLVKANINGLLKGRFEHNVFLEPGDIVNIPPTEVFFVAGEVKQPGSFPLKEGTTLRQAISLAQGLNFNAAAGKGIIFRENPDTGGRQEISVDIGAVMSAKKDDQAILPNDIILIPNSKMKKLAGPIFNAFALNAVMLPLRY